jgi:hypothetical protein
LFASLTLSTRHFFIRKFKGTYKAYDLGVDTCLITNGCFCIQAILLTMKSGDEGSDFTWSWEIFFQATLAGILMDSGRILIGMAVAVG